MFMVMRGDLWVHDERKMDEIGEREREVECYKISMRQKKREGLNVNYRKWRGLLASFAWICGRLRRRHEVVKDNAHV